MWEGKENGRAWKIGYGVLAWADLKEEKKKERLAILLVEKMSESELV